MSYIATRDAYGEALKELGALMPSLVVLDADLSGSTKTGEFKKDFPERFFNVGIAEQNMVGVAAGLATTGKIPFVSTFAVFATGRAFEQIRNSVAHCNLNVKIAATHAGITVGEDGASHQAIEDIAIMRVLPNMTVIVPADAKETKQAIKFAATHRGPVYIRMGRLAVPQIFDESYSFNIGKANQIMDGEDATIISCGLMTSKAIEAAFILKEQGINVRVLNMASIKPIDKEAIISAAEDTRAIVTVEEHSVIGGLGGAVAEVLTQNMPAHLEIIGINDRFGQSGTPDELLNKYDLTIENIIDKVKKVIIRKITKN